MAWLIQRFSNSRKVKSTISLVKILCLVWPASTRLHPGFPDDPPVPYVVGMNLNSPLNPHSALASGGNDSSKINTSHTREAYMLYGGVVWGPDKKDECYNIRDYWPQTGVNFLRS